MKSLHTDPIPNGTRFVALYGDGSGSRLFKVREDGLLVDSHDNIQSRRPDVHLIDRGFTHWLPLPETFRLWFEQKAGGE